MGTMLGFLGKWFERARQAVRVVRGRYDAARTTDDNRRHWAEADGLSASAANSPDVRQKLRNRSRYEFDNNGYCNGLIVSLARDMIGTGPRLSILDESIARAIEDAWQEWAETVNLVGDLTTMVQAKKRDGEAFAILVTGEGDYRSPVRLRLRLAEADQVATPNWTWVQKVDGIELDASGRPAYYHVLKYHPGDSLWYGALPGEYDRVPAEQMLHWFRRDRPGQYRGVPETTPSLGLYAQLRRYTLAVLTAAETAADFSALVETDGPAAETVDWLSLEIDRGMMMTLPAGARIKQLQAEQPTTTYKDFKREILTEIGRPHHTPYNTVSGDSSSYNYSSARLDSLLYRSALRVERDSFRRAVLDRVFRAWLDEALMIPDYLPAGAQRARWVWYWPGYESVDPNKDAQADTERLTNGTATLAEILGEYGQDWRAFLRQRGVEVALMRELGIPVPGEAAPAAPATPIDETEEEEDEVI